MNWILSGYISTCRDSECSPICWLQTNIYLARNYCLCVLSTFGRLQYTLLIIHPKTTSALFHYWYVWFCWNIYNIIYCRQVLLNAGVDCTKLATTLLSIFTQCWQCLYSKWICVYNVVVDKKLTWCPPLLKVGQKGIYDGEGMADLSSLLGALVKTDLSSVQTSCFVGVVLVQYWPTFKVLFWNGTVGA